MDNTELFISHGDNAAMQNVQPAAANEAQPTEVQSEAPEVMEPELESEQTEAEPEIAPQEERVEEVGETLEVDHTIVEQAPPQEMAPDPLADIKAKIAGYPLPTPEIGNMRPPIPPRPGTKLQ